MPYTWRQPTYPADGTDQSWINPTMIIVLQDGDMDQAIEPLMRTLEEPVGAGKVAAVFVQEPIRKAFIEKVTAQMKVMHHQCSTHKNYLSSLQRLECLNAEIVSMQAYNEYGFIRKMVPGSPVMVCDFTQGYFSREHPSCITTLHTFRTVRELPELIAAEHLKFVSASLWSKKMAAAYEATLNLKVPTVMINCTGISIWPIVEFYRDRKPQVVLANGYHYEALIQDTRRKMIIFPYKNVSQSAEKNK